jgi:membrane fusion protein (multidrug efflux system)
MTALALAAFVGGQHLAENWSHESTDDAFIDGHVVAVASKIAGEVVLNHVVENQDVKAGDPLVEIDPRAFEARVNQKRAALQSSQANQHAIEAGFELLRARMSTAEATRKQSEAEAEAAKASYENALANWKRAQTLWSTNKFKAISQQDYDTALAVMNSTKANWQAAIEKAASDASKVVESHAQLTTAEKLNDQAVAQIGQSQADLQTAELDLSYAKLAAPVTGRITRKMVEKGAYVQVGQSLLAIVRPDVWVTANFKETQTAHIRPGQPVHISVDGAGDHVFRGHVESLQSGSGARFSLLPPENAVGNYVKVVQRVPVKIVFDDPVQAIGGLGPGMSVSPSVQIGERPISNALLAVFSIALAVIVGIIIWILASRSK